MRGVAEFLAGVWRAKFQEAGRYTGDAAPLRRFFPAGRGRPVSKSNSRVAELRPPVRAFERKKKQVRQGQAEIETFTHMSIDKKNAITLDRKMKLDRNIH